jgi:hypothetical protein
MIEVSCDPKGLKGKIWVKGCSSVMGDQILNVQGIMETEDGRHMFVLRELGRLSS